jgi:hypothetical protein
MATQELDFTQLDELIARIKDAQAHQLSLSPADLQLVLDCIVTFRRNSVNIPPRRCLMPVI